MIYTITSNPSLDYYVKIDELKTGYVNRSEGEDYDAAGKGVNVSKILNNLGIPSITLGFLGGFNKNYYLDILSSYLNIQPQFTSIKENTRINIKVRGEKETSLNAKGPKISEDEYTKFSNRLTNIFDNDYVVVSGNIQDELKAPLISDIKKLIDEGVKIVLDTDNDITEELVESKPFLIKANYNDIGENEDDILALGKECVSRGAKYFMYSSAYAPSYLVEKDCYYKCEVEDRLPMSLTGSGDAMIAGFLWASLRGANSIEAFTYANATAISSDIHDRKNYDVSTINKTYDTIEIQRFDLK